MIFIKKSNYIPMLISILSFTPITLISYEQTGLPLSDLLIPIGFIIYLLFFYTQYSLYISSIIFFSLLSILLSSLIFQQEIFYRNLFSLIFLIKPIFGFFIGYFFINTKNNINIFFKTSNIVILAFFAVCLLNIITVHNGIVRSDSYINGDFLGLPIFGTYGVNSLAAFYFICLFLSFFNFDFLNEFKSQKIICALNIIIITFFIVSSLSRMAILGALFAHLFFFLDRNQIYKSFSTLFFCILIVFLVNHFDFSSLSNFTEAKIDQIKLGLENKDLNYISSGRVALYYTALNEFFTNPFIGSYFGGYNSEISGFPETQGLSPHNMYITTFWKMGLIGGVVYFYFLYNAAKNSISNDNLIIKKWLTRFIIINAFILFNLWDVLVIPNYAFIFFLLLGIFSKNHENHTTKKSDATRVFN
ncbi:O-antigen ligase family protein [Alcaligenes aquatilis]|uniref:O-antigen ligase family protein n=1 Tax=Alcaligenes aquatilis TaxID=323284 RepID=UPI0013CED048|nr:O-antigen ligase family protein [Alcaligenes aquatilis]